MADSKPLARSRRGRFVKTVTPRIRNKESKILIDHNYSLGLVCEGSNCSNETCWNNEHRNIGKHVDRNGWRRGRRIVEFGTLLENLRHCKQCHLGPVPLTYDTVVGEMKKGLSGYLYVMCQNVDCFYVNRVAYGKTHRQKKTGMPCFAAKTKLGTAMIDSIGGPVKVNNFLATMNVPPIDNKNLKKMERRAGEKIEKVSYQSSKTAAVDAFKREMEDVRIIESMEAETSFDGIIEDLGICPMQDCSPSLKRSVMQLKTPDDEQLNVEWSEEEDVIDDDSSCIHVATNISQSTSTPETKKSFISFPGKPHKKQKTVSRPRFITKKVSTRLSPKYPCKTQRGMSCAVDCAWHKRGFDSLTSHTFFMSKAKYGKKVIKTVVSHRTCGTCKWWARNRPGLAVRVHRCVQDHRGSARLMESISGQKGIEQLAMEGTPVEYLEGDGDTTLIARLKTNAIDIKKRFDRNHVVKNVGKSLYALAAGKEVKLSKIVISHLQKCLKYIFAKNQGNKEGMAENLKALVPHQFGDHSLCAARFCGYKRKPDQVYSHRSLPYKSSLKDIHLQSRLDKIYKPLIENAAQYTDLGSSQQCEHANREVTLRAPKSLHYGNSESLDQRVHATSAFINEGRHYIIKAHTEACLSPGEHTVKYAEKCLERRKRVSVKSALPSSKRRRLILKQERNVSQAAQETLEGVSYQSGIGHEAKVDIEKLPEAVPHGHFKPIPHDCLNGKPTFICVDLETTDLIRSGRIPHITQISAVEVNSGTKFDQYIVPKQPITYTAQQITGINVHVGTMTVHGETVNADSVNVALEKFRTYLDNFSNVFFNCL